MFQTISETVLTSVPLSVRIQDSGALDDTEKKQFLSLLSYFTPDELAELRQLV